MLAAICTRMYRQEVRRKSMEYGFFLTNSGRELDFVKMKTGNLGNQPGHLLSVQYSI